MALWVSFSDWTGRGSPFSSNVNFVGVDNYAAVTTGGGLAERDFGTALRNNAWYVLLVVPLQTALALFLAVLVNRAVLRGRGSSAPPSISRRSPVPWRSPCCGCSSSRHPVPSTRCSRGSA